MAAPTLLALVALLAAPALRVEGDSRCPEPAAVSRALEALPLPPGAASDRAELVPDERGVRIRLLDGSGKSLADRLLSTDAPCAERADAAAVMLAAWESELRGGLAPPAPAPAKRQALQPRPPPGVEGAPGSPSFAWSVDLGLGPSLANDVSGTAQAGATLGPASSRLAARVEGFASLPRSQRLGPGQFQWFRAGGALGPSLRAAPDPAALDLWLGLQVAYLEARGAGYAENHLARGWDLGACGALRASWKLGRLGVFAEVNVGGWFRRQRLRVEGVTVQAELPRLEGRLIVGGQVGSL